MVWRKMGYMNHDFKLAVLESSESGYTKMKAILGRCKGYG
jgi:hypothetical protein